MTRKYHENDFTTHDYDEFYEDHYFQPFSDDAALNIHELLPRVAWALDVAQEMEPTRVLDLGCLEGFTVLTLANHVPSIKAGVGIDLSKDGISLGMERASKFKLPVVFFQMTLEKYLEDCVKSGEKFDLITAFEVMEHVKDTKQVFELMDKVLAPGGVILVSTPAFESPTYGKNDVANKCHVRLFTTKDEDYEEMTDVPDPDTGKPYIRAATSLSKQIGKERIIEMDVINELINCRYR